MQEFIIKGQVDEKIEELKKFIENAPKENVIQLTVDTGVEVKLNEVMVETAKISKLFDNDRTVNFNCNTDTDLDKKEMIITIKI